MRTPEQIAAAPAVETLAPMESLIDVAAALVSHTYANGIVGAGYVRNVQVPLSALVADHDTMVGVVRDVVGGLVSETPHEPVDLCLRVDATGRYEIADGHHRVAAAMLAGETHIVADIYPMGDDEPYEGPFYDFEALVGVLV